MPAFVNEMERQLRLNEDVLRFLTLRVEDIDAGQSAILSREASERDRNFRGPKPAARFSAGSRRGFGDRTEFRAREVPDKSQTQAKDPAEDSAPIRDLPEAV